MKALPVKSDTGRQNHIWERKKDLKKYFYLQTGGTQSLQTSALLLCRVAAVQHRCTYPNN